MSHEIRTPLNGIRLAETALDKTTDRSTSESIWGL